MNVCSTYPCLRTSAGCPICDPKLGLQTSWPISISPPPSPRTIPVNIPFSNFGVTVVTLDRDGNITIKVDQVIEARKAQGE